MLHVCLIVFVMRAHKSNIDNPGVIVDFDHQAILIPRDIENNAIAVEEACTTKPGLYIHWLPPRGMKRFPIPRFQRRSCVLASGGIPKITQHLFRDYAHTRVPKLYHKMGYLCVMVYPFVIIGKSCMTMIAGQMVSLRSLFTQSNLARLPHPITATHFPSTTHAACRIRPAARRHQRVYWLDRRRRRAFRRGQRF